MRSKNEKIKIRVVWGEIVWGTLWELKKIPDFAPLSKLKLINAVLLHALNKRLFITRGKKEQKIPRSKITVFCSAVCMVAAERKTLFMLLGV